MISANEQITDEIISEMEESIMMNESTLVEIDEHCVNEVKTTGLRVRNSKSKSKTRAAKSPAGVCTVVNSEKNGKRVTISKELSDELGNIETVEIGFTENGIVVGNKLPENGTEFRFKKSGNKGVIYSSSLVDEVTEEFKLDFSNRVSITFVDAEEIEVDGEHKAFEIKVKKD